MGRFRFGTHVELTLRGSLMNRRYRRQKFACPSCVTLVFSLIFSLIFSLDGCPGADGQSEPFSDTHETPRPRLKSAAQAGGSLPWAQPETDSSSSGMPTSARALLVAIDDSQLELFRDREPIGINEDEVLTKILYRLSRFAPETIERHTTNLVDLAALLEDPDSSRFQVVELTGRIRRLQLHPILPELAERLEFNHYWQATVELDDDATIVLFTPHVPAGWAATNDMNEVIRVRAMFLKIGDLSGRRPEFVFAARNIGWLPERVDLPGGISPELVRLAGLGFDVSLFDLVRSTNGQPIGKSERETFYQLLAAVNRAPDAFWREPPEAFDLGPLIQAPHKQHGRYLLVEGTARAVKRVQIEDAETRERFGIDHYFEVDVLVSLGNQKVRIGTAGPVFSNSYPVTCCVLHVPDAWLRLLSSQGVGKLRDAVQIAGFSYKLWGYRSEIMDREARPADAAQVRNLQVSPMIVGSVAVLAPSQPPPDTSGTFLGTIGMLFVAVLMFVLWLYHRSDKRNRRRPAETTIDITRIVDSAPSRPNVAAPPPDDIPT